ncbi:MAG: YbgC/FadM family acyl-CoA thioesterase [Gammaproteobacteria bacterium]|nr:YbgC/FadM family acyl-CoA thioesterase [Gammaproteobacteria bacterium]
MASAQFEWPIRVYYEDTDLQGVVYYANYFRYMERARTEWLRSLGVEQDRLLSEERKFFVVVDTYAEFLKPALFNEMLVATARLAELARASFLIEQNIYRESVDGDLLCRGRVKAAYVDADTRRPLRVPASIFEGKVQ